MTITTVNPKGQVTIPESLRRKYGFPPGTKVVWIERDGHIYPQRLLSLDEMQGMFKPKRGERSLTRALLEERRADREREARPARP